LRFAEQMREQTQKRQQMKQALKSVLTPLLRKAGFSGICPRFRRLQPARYDLLMFCFDKFYDSFGIEIGQCAPDWFPQPFRRDGPPEKLIPWDLELKMRARIKPRPGRMVTDNFQYGDARTPEDFRRIAEAVGPFLRQAVAMFDNFSQVEKMDKL